MKTAAEFITRHRHLLLIALLSVTLLISSNANRRRLEDDTVFTSIPVTQTDNDTRRASVAAYTSERDAAYHQDVAALTSLIAEDAIDEQTRQRAADQLQALIRHREARDAIEEALATTSLSPCAAVVTDDALTLVTAKSAPSAEDSALVITLAAAHAGVAPEDVRILSTE